MDVPNSMTSVQTVLGGILPPLEEKFQFGISECVFLSKAKMPGLPFLLAPHSILQACLLLASWRMKDHTPLSLKRTHKVECFQLQLSISSPSFFDFKEKQMSGSWGEAGIGWW